MQSLTVLAHTCLYEGFGLVVAEAMAAGVPVVAAETGAMPYLVEHGRTGFLVPFGDSQAMAEAIACLLTDSNRAKEMGEKGREKTNRLWRTETFADSIAQVYTQLFNSKVKNGKTDS